VFKPLQRLGKAEKMRKQTQIQLHLVVPAQQNQPILCSQRLKRQDVKAITYLCF
jgi:hypothetical protein